MATNSYTSICPKCGNEDMNVVASNRPYDSVQGDCLNCGFYYYTVEAFMTLDEVNAQRADLELEPITELAEAEDRPE